MIKKTTEIFIEQCKSKHDNYYDYSLVDYTTSHNKVKIICPIHGIFDQEAGSHLKGYGCKKCASEKMSRERSHTTDQFIKKAKEVHGDRYDYSLVEYIGESSKVIIKCNKHGIFHQKPAIHNRGSGCSECSIKTRSHTTDQFIKKAKEVHGDRYDYSLVEYTNSTDKVKIICPIHGIFEQRPNNHVNIKQHCPKCSYIMKSYNIKSLDPRTYKTRLKGLKRKRAFKSTDQFIKKAKEVHGDRYDYSLVEYTNSTDKVKIICPIHGTFIKEANSHIMGYGCNSCSTKNSIGYYCKNNLKATNITGFLYFIKFKGNEGEIFYKIGITKRANPLHRYSSKQYENYEILYMYTKSMNLYDAFVIEQFFKQKYKHFAYKPLNRFMGYTECFSAPILNRTHFI